MSIRHAAYIAGIFEHPRREIPDRSVSQIHAEVASGALEDAGLSFGDVDGFLSSSTSNMSLLALTEYLGVHCTYLDSTDSGGSSALVHVGHAAAAIAAGKCSVALITLAGRPRTAPASWQLKGDQDPSSVFDGLWGIPGAVSGYALAAQRHMYEFGTTSRQLAEVKVTASRHAQYNPNAWLRDPMTVEEVLESPMISSPLHRADCCVVTDGGGALVVVSPEVARSLGRTEARILGHGEAMKHSDAGRVDLTYTGAASSGPRAFEEARVGPKDIDYASLYDSFTITVIETLEDLGFCEKGQGGAFVLDGALNAPDGQLPFNTDGGGLCNNHPFNRGGMTKVIEAVRQLRGEAHPAVQVPSCTLALAHGTGGSLGTRMASATLIMERPSD